MDINKEFEKLAEEFEKEWHDGHESQGIDDQYVEEMEDGEEIEEASKSDIQSFGKKLSDYAKKRGGIDKDDFKFIAKEAIGGHLPNPKSLSRMDTEPREVVLDLMGKEFGRKFVEKEYGIKFNRPTGYKEEFELNEALKPKDQKVIDAFYDKKELEGKLLYTDGDKLEKLGMGRDTVAVWKGHKIEITSSSAVKSDDVILRYMKKSIPKLNFDPKSYKKYFGEEVEVEIEEKKSHTGYELYHKDFSSAIQHAIAHAKKKGHIVDPKEIDDKVATGPKKPSSGKTNRYALKAGRKTVQIQIANLDNKRYELNMYIEDYDKNKQNSI